MATMRLIPSSYSSSNSNYATVYSGETNMYNNTSNTSSYASLRGRNNSTTTAYYIFIKGFNFSSLPSNANVTSFKVMIRCYRNSYQRTGDAYRLRLASSTNINNTISNSTTSTEIGTTADVIEIPTGNLTWDTLSGYGSNFSIVVPLSSTSSSRPYIYVYGAEIEVTYSLSDPRTITSTLTGNGTIDPNGAQTYYDGDTYELHITPTNSSDAITVTNNGTDVTSQLVAPGTINTTDDTVLGTYALTSGSFNGSGATYFSGLVGKGYNNTQTTSNYYSGGSSTIAVFTYEMGITVPSGATITDCYVMVNGHAESTSQSNEYMCAQIYAGSTAISDELNFKSIGTSNSTQTIHATTMPTAAQCANLKLQCRLGYYGGAINGATMYVTYTVTTDYYTYTYTVSGNATIAVTIGSGGGSTPKIYLKQEGSSTLLYTDTNNDSDETITTYATTYGGALAPDDNIKVVFTNLEAWNNGAVRTTTDSEEIDITLESLSEMSYTRTDDYGSRDIKARVETTRYNSQYMYRIYPSYIYNNSYCDITGTMDIYKMDSATSWVECSKVYLKVNGSWVEQSSSNWLTLLPADSNYRLIET